MRYPWQSGAVLCLAVALHAGTASRADMVDPALPSQSSVQAPPDIAIAIGQGADPATGAIGIRPFPRLTPEPSAGPNAAIGEGLSATRDIVVPGVAEAVSLPEVVAAARNDPAQAPADENSGAVNEWTGQLDAQEPPALAPPPVRQAPRDAPGRAPSGMGSESVQ